VASTSHRPGSSGHVCDAGWRGSPVAPSWHLELPGDTLRLAAQHTEGGGRVSVDPRRCPISHDGRLSPRLARGCGALGRLSYREHEDQERTAGPTQGGDRMDVRAAASSTTRSGSGTARRDRWLTGVIAVLSVAVVTLGASIVVRSGTEGPTPARSTGAPEVEPAGGAGSAASAGQDLATIAIAGPRIVRHVDESITAFRRGEMAHFRSGYSGTGAWGDARYLRFDEATGRMVRVHHVLPLVGTRDVERTSPITVVARSGGGNETWSDDTWTVVFTVRAGAEEQMWVERWTTPWGEQLDELWVIPTPDLFRPSSSAS